MPNPRFAVDLTEIDAAYVTLKAHSSVTKTDLDTVAKVDTGVAVTLTGNATAGKGSSASRLFGKAVKFESDGVLSVAYEGFHKLKYTGTAPTVGASVACHGDGTVEAASANGDNTVVSVDTATTTCVVSLG